MRPMTTTKSERVWSLHRMDDNGHSFLVRGGLSREDAERLLAHYTEHGHKQTYTIEEEADEWQEVRSADDRQASAEQARVGFATSELSFDFEGNDGRTVSLRVTVPGRRLSKAEALMAVEYLKSLATEWMD